MLAGGVANSVPWRKASTGSHAQRTFGANRAMVKRASGHGTLSYGDPHLSLMPRMVPAGEAGAWELLVLGRSSVTRLSFEQAQRQ
jgi:hypothetical protein